ncbi:contact-dependent growth inhibition system immunity protein, partial [Actinokineospora pegani]|uniref:contact-dependent growth inhibition system immunity protein n=1 Tax=Actinokineospora pegani TaxID=2654637 RepID=UPI0012EA8776
MHNPSTSNLDEDDLNDDNLGEDGFGLSDLSSYFHQDWSLRFATERGVVIAYVTELPPAFARVLAEDAQHLVNHGDGHLANDLWQAAAGLSNGSRSIPIGLG